jgi:hypothetical protein
MVRGMRLRFVFGIATTASAIAGCESGPPIKTASGELIDTVRFEETFPLSNDVKESSLGGERLRNAVVLMDRHRIFDLRGEYKATGVLDKGTLTVVVKPVAGAERRTTFKSCGHEAICAFYAEASANGVIDHTPVLCRNPVPCDKPRSEK